MPSERNPRLHSRTLAGYLLAVLMLAVAGVLVLSSLRSFQELDRMRSLYLRSRAAFVASNLEALPPAVLAEGAFERLAEEEPSLADLQFFAPGYRGPDAAIVASILEGRELFRTVESGAVYRVYVPFHSAGETRVARIDLARSAADFLLEHSRHNIWISSASGALLVLLSCYLAWSGRQAARLERRRLEIEHLAHLGKMSAVLAHEIRNPLGTMKGFVQLAREKASADLVSLLDPVIGEAQRLEKLVNDLLAYGRPQRAEPRSVNWQPMAQKLAAHARQAIGARPIVFSATSEDFTFVTDPALLEQALLNLLRNAIEAIPEGGAGEIRLGAVFTPPARVDIEIEDNGPGLPASVREKLFEPFQTTKPFGAGLGLSITRKLAHSLGGRLELYDRAPQGLRATVVLDHGNHPHN